MPASCMRTRQFGEKAPCPQNPGVTAGRVSVAAAGSEVSLGNERWDGSNSRGREESSGTAEKLQCLGEIGVGSTGSDEVGGSGSDSLLSLGRLASSWLASRWPRLMERRLVPFRPESLPCLSVATLHSRLRVKGEG